MNLLKKMKVRKKLVLSFVIVSILITTVGLMGIISLKTVNVNSEDMYSNNLQSVYMLTDMKQNLTEINSDTIQLVFIRDSSKKADLEKDISANKDEDDKYIASCEKLLMSDIEKQVWPVFIDQLTQYRALRDNIYKSIDANNIDDAIKQYQQISVITDAMFQNLDKLINDNVSSAKTSNTNNHLAYLYSNRVMTIFMIIGFIIAIGLGLIISSDINKPLQKMMDQAESLANFDLSHNYQVTREDEFGKTGGALVKAQENLKQLIKTIMESSQDMSASSEELSATIEELSSKTSIINESINTIVDGIQQRSAASEEISASVEEVDTSISELSERAMEGSNNASQFKARATDVQNSSKKAIEDIRKLYDEKQNNMLKAIEEGKVVENIKIMADTIANISGQTNLLALNAAIEAARAGNQGRGFAVVAEEVRKLAEQSSEAVTSIKDTISKVQAAFKSSTDTGNDLLKFINTDVYGQLDAYGHTGSQYYNDSDFVSKMSEEIASMSEELTATVGQVSQAVQNMSVTAQKSTEETEIIKESLDENTKAIEQIALTAQSQSEDAQKLNEMVQKFKL